MSTNILKSENGEFSNLDQAVRLAEMIAKSDLAPAAYKNKPANVLIAMQMGAEVGLAPMQAIQNIAVIKGRPCVWGDAMLALAQNHPAYVSCGESFDENTMTAACTVTRKNEKPYTVTFSKADAEKAGLWNRESPSPWAHYPKRMLQMRARGFALRDKFADAMKGLRLAEEVRDYVVSETVEHKEKLENILLNHDEKKDDSQQTNQAQATEQDIKIPPNCIDSKQLMIAQDLIQTHDVDVAKCYEFFKINSLKDLAVDKFDEFVDMVARKKKKEVK